MTKIIGLTGGIGSGKTTVAKMFIALGIPVFISDDEAKEIMKNHETIAEIESVFGNKIISNHEINRSKLAEIVFNDKEQLNRLNSIIHPKVKQKFDEWHKKHDKKPFVVKESAIFFESKSHLNCHKIICVTAPLTTRIQRVMQRDKCSEQEVLSRISKQIPESEKIALSNFIINNIDIKSTENQVYMIYNSLIAK
jgi:dephospho-CoA kinase